MSTDTTVNIELIQDKPIELLVADVSNVQTTTQATLTDEEYKKQLDVVIELQGLQNSKPGLVYCLLLKLPKLDNKSFIQKLAKLILKYPKIARYEHWIIFGILAFLYVVLYKKYGVVFCVFLLYPMFNDIENSKNENKNKIISLEYSVINYFIICISSLLIFISYKGIYYFITHTSKTLYIFTWLGFIILFVVIAGVLAYIKNNILLKIVKYGACFCNLLIYISLYLWIITQIMLFLSKHLLDMIPEKGFLSNKYDTLYICYVWSLMVVILPILVIGLKSLITRYMKLVDKKWDYYKISNKIGFVIFVVMLVLPYLLGDFNNTYEIYKDYMSKQDLLKYYQIIFLVLIGSPVLLIDLLVQEYFIDKKLFGEVGEVRST